MKIKFIALVLILIFPAVFLFLPAPTGPAYSGLQGQALVLGFLYTLYAFVFIGHHIGRSHEHLAARVLTGVLTLCAMLLLLKLFGVCALLFKTFVLCSSCALVGVYLALESRIRLQGLVSLLLFLLVVSSFESMLRALPAAALSKSVTSIAPLAPADRGNELLRKQGFRGRQACSDCATPPYRIVAMGGSSTYGIPLPSASQAFSEQLQRLLDSSAGEHSYEVLNAGIPGYGIVQVIDSLEKYVLQFHPDMVIINSWFNDSAKSSGWYGYVGLSDREAQDRVELFRKVERSRLYRFVSRLRLYGIFHHYVLQAFRQEAKPRDRKAARKDRRRMNADEFKLELERIVALGQKYNFTPVFMYEVTNRQEDLSAALSKNAYLRAVSDVAAKSGSPLVDTITPFAARRGDWLFSDFIHPNRDGHQLVAETIFGKLFAGQQNRKFQALRSTVTRDANVK